MDAQALFKFDPMAAISYGQYNSVKGKDGSFEDFLLHYNSYEANEGNSDWLTKMIGKDNLTSIMKNGELLKSLSLTNFMSSLSTSEFLTTKAEALKLQAMSKLAKDGYSYNYLDMLNKTSNMQNALIG